MTELLQEFIALGVKSLPSSPQTQSKGSKIDKASPSVNLQDQNCVSGARVLTGTVHNANESHLFTKKGYERRRGADCKDRYQGD